MQKHSKTILIVCLSLIMVCSLIILQREREYTIVFYNVENLFDTIDDPQTRDEDFLPEGKLNWTPKRYQDKLSKIDKVLYNINPKDLPEIIGLCEVENRQVLQDLIEQEELRKGDYKIVHQESPDNRGIDCALLYRSKKFKYLNHNAIPVQITPTYNTRDILYVKGIIGKKDTIHLFVNHWPSRRGGLIKSEPNRIFAAGKLRNTLDSLYSLNSKANIIIMGDLNDEPSNRSVEHILIANNQIDNPNNLELYNLMYDQHIQERGSYNYRGQWNMLDNLIVSQNLLHRKSSYHTSTKSGQIYNPQWISYRNKREQWTPSRTYGGKKYFGGYSDHYPVFFKLNRR